MATRTAAEKRPGWKGAVALTAALRAVPEADRLDAMTMFFDAACRTEWFTKAAG